MLNLLTEPVIESLPGGAFTLPGTFAALARDEVETFPALRPHQAPALHMFLGQLAALALNAAGEKRLPDTESAWRTLLRGLTPDYPDDEPWRLVVEDASKPGFMQPPVPAGMTLPNVATTPDELDMLITARNHDLKRAIARFNTPQDWIFALISLQTCEGYSGRSNNGIVRMNGGSSSRPMLGLAPLPAGGKVTIPRPGAHFVRDVRVLLETRDTQLDDYTDYPLDGGLGLTWLAPWPEGTQLELKDLDLWFIEVCRRVRLEQDGERLFARTGLSQQTRINAKHLNGAVGDPWAPVSRADKKSFTLSGRDFDYRVLSELLANIDWKLPVLATVQDDERETMAIVAQALARGNSKTEGFKSRILPIGGKALDTFRARHDEGARQQVHDLAKDQIDIITAFDKALSGTLALVAADGDWDKRSKDDYDFAKPARDHLTRSVDAIFFDHLWRRVEAQDAGADAAEAARQDFIKAVAGLARDAFEAALPAIPCNNLFRFRAETRARDAFRATIRKQFGDGI